MTRRRVYLETTIISYLTSRPSRDVVSAAHQKLTLDWWERRRLDFDLVISEVVAREAEVGDPAAAARRLSTLDGLPRLPVTERVAELASEFLSRRLLPGKAANDGLHIAIATLNDVDYLLTWNCTHIANPEIQAQLARFLVERGLLLPYICTPEELLGGES